MVFKIIYFSVYWSHLIAYTALSKELLYILELELPFRLSLPGSLFLNRIKSHFSLTKTALIKKKNSQQSSTLVI